MLAKHLARHFSSVAPYFRLSHSIPEIKQLYQGVADIEQCKNVNINTGGRIIGKRKASKNLVFLDV